MNFALGYLAGAHLRFHLLVFKSDPLDECEYTLWKPALAGFMQNATFLR